MTRTEKAVIRFAQVVYAVAWILAFGAELAEIGDDATDDDVFSKLRGSGSA